MSQFWLSTSRLPAVARNTKNLPPPPRGSLFVQLATSCAMKLSNPARDLRPRSPHPSDPLNNSNCVFSGPRQPKTAAVIYRGAHERGILIRAARAPRKSATIFVVYGEGVKLIFDLNGRCYRAFLLDVAVRKLITAMAAAGEIAIPGDRKRWVFQIKLDRNITHLSRDDVAIILK